MNLGSSARGDRLTPLPCRPGPRAGLLRGEYACGVSTHIAATLRRLQTRLRCASLGEVSWRSCCFGLRAAPWPWRLIWCFACSAPPSWEVCCLVGRVPGRCSVSSQHYCLYQAQFYRAGLIACTSQSLGSICVLLFCSTRIMGMFSASQWAFLLGPGSGIGSIFACSAYSGFGRLLQAQFYRAGLIACTSQSLGITVCCYLRPVLLSAGHWGYVVLGLAALPTMVIGNGHTYSVGTGLMCFVWHSL